MNATLDAINAPCIGFHGSVTCGPLAQLSQTEKNIGIVAAQSALQVRQTGELITASAQTVKDVSAHLSRTADAATGTLNAASDTLGAGKATILALQPVIGHSDAAVQHLDALIQSKDLADAIHHANGMTGSGDVILANAAQVSTKAKEDYMKARTPWGKFVTTGLDLIHLGAYAAR
ncbi:MAG TPA: hypothetical protein VMV57_02200 [Terracidiphilus sp.]|nr:hypothetical protein [Terracidiphilus sp.]